LAAVKPSMVLLPALVLLFAVVRLSGCHRTPSPAEQAAEDDRAVAQVEAIQKQRPPPRPIFPQPIAFADIQAHALYGAGCAFIAEGSRDAVLIARDKAGYLKLGDRIVRLASDPGSASLPIGGWSRYVGKEFAVTLGKADRAGEPRGGAGLRWPGGMTITDPFDQTVYGARGWLECGS
jgi:hypothetical protein